MDQPAPTRRLSIAPLTAVIAIAVVIVDQLTKWWAINNLVDRNIDLFWTLRLNLAFNTGMAFSRGQGMGPVIGVLALLIVVGLLLSLRRGTSRLADVAVGLIIGGAVGNVIDRLFRSPGWLRGGVVDFIDFQWFPIFNVADMAITIGGTLLVLGSVLTSRESSDAVTTAAGDPSDVSDHVASEPESQ